MKNILLAGVACLAFVAPAFAQTPNEIDTPEAPAKEKAAAEVFSTGVAKGRDRLDAAISTSSLKGSEIDGFSARSVGDILRHIPGVRSEHVVGEGNANYSIRGLPLASNGSKFLQFQEDGLPVLEFGDMLFAAPDLFLRADLNLAQIEAIRGGSASTFASNSPGGVINFLSKTGDVEGGAVQVSTGINYGEQRADFDYGSKISDTLRFHIGGFYRNGEGPRKVGFDAYRGGQLKFNITKQFESGYIRFYAKLLDDRSPMHQGLPIGVSGTNENPTYSNLPSFDIKQDSLMSRNIRDILTLDRTNDLQSGDLRDGMHAKQKSFGVETQFDVAGWSITEKFRFSKMSADINFTYPLAVAPAGALVGMLGGPGATLSYASGPNAGSIVANPSSLNGNGLLSLALLMDGKLSSLDNMTNDLRASRTFQLGRGKFTTTVGFYKSTQDYVGNIGFSTVLQDVIGDGNASLLDVRRANGDLATQGGYVAYSLNGLPNMHRAYDVTYNVNAPYGSVNYHIGKIAIGGSLRYDYGSVKGTLFGGELGGGRLGVMAYDIDGDGTISVPESKTAFLPLSSPGAVDYKYNYLSYSTGINYRIAEPLAVFARYSRGARAAADRALFNGPVNTVSGRLVDPKAGYDVVKQTELGMKFRKDGIAINITGFLAKTGERNVQINTDAAGDVQLQPIVRGYEAKGVELEGSFARGPFSVTAGATYTDAEITSDQTNAALVGNTPRHQAKLIYAVTPQVSTKMFTVGADIIGTTSSYAQDTNQLKQPGYRTVNAFMQFRPVERVQLMLNVNNLFNTLGVTEVTQATIPMTGIVTGQTIYGRTISGALRFSL